MAPIAGWYDDPRDPDRVRYWDGETWTEHTAQRPAADDASPTWHFPGAPQSQQQDWQYGARQQPPPGPAVTGAPAPAAFPQQSQQQSQQHPPYQQPPGGYPPGWAPAWPTGPRTPDGAVITSWAKRFAAWLLDAIIVFVVSLPFTGYFLYRYTQQVLDEMDAGTMNGFLPSAQAIRWELAFLAVLIVVEVCYHALFLRYRGATPGKRALGISVREWSRGGVLPWGTIARRVGFIYGLALVGQVPYVGALASIALILDYLWPLWDKQNQALHDKVAGTGVIEGPRIEPPG